MQTQIKIAISLNSIFELRSAQESLTLTIYLFKNQLFTFNSCYIKIRVKNYDSFVDLDQITTLSIIHEISFFYFLIFRIFDKFDVVTFSNLEYFILVKF